MTTANQDVLEPAARANAGWQQRSVMPQRMEEWFDKAYGYPVRVIHANKTTCWVKHGIVEWETMTEYLTHRTKRAYEA